MEKLLESVSFVFLCWFRFAVIVLIGVIVLSCSVIRLGVGERVRPPLHTLLAFILSLVYSPEY